MEGIKLSSKYFVSTSLRQQFNQLSAITPNLKDVCTDYEHEFFTHVELKSWLHKQDAIKRFKFINLDTQFNSENILVSVIMPTYNQSQWIENSVNTILNQTHKNFELIIVNDGSTDDTKIYLDSFLGGSKKIKIIHKQNGGTGSAINEGLKIAQGKYVTWVSSDNLYYPTYLETLVDVLEYHPNVQYAMSGFDWNNIPLGQSQKIIFQETGMYNKSKIKQQYESGICFLYRTDVLNRLHFYSIGQGEDYLFLAKLGLFGDMFYVGESLGMYQDHENTLSRKSPERTHETERVAKQIAHSY